MTEGIKMYHLDKKQIQEITDYIFLEDRLERADAIFIPGCARPVSYTHLDVYKRQGNRDSLSN